MSAMFLSNPKHALKIFYDLRIFPIISQFVLRLLESIRLFCSEDFAELDLVLWEISSSGIAIAVLTVLLMHRKCQNKFKLNSM